MTGTEAGVRQYPAAMVNITNKCNLRCRHCFIFRDGTPNEQTSRMDAATIVARLTELQRRHGIQTMLWMGGEPLLRPDVLREGVKIFPRNHITTNGTFDLLDLPDTTYVISIDGPPDLNDDIRGKGTFGKIMRTLSRLPDTFAPTVMAQCVVTRTNEDRLEELVERLRPTRIEA
jgi:sulfatase maturation enzyme AslB (radical SAM superfamily)